MNGTSRGPLLEVKNVLALRSGWSVPLLGWKGAVCLFRLNTQQKIIVSFRKVWVYMIWTTEVHIRIPKVM